MNLVQAIMERKSIRGFKETPVPQDVLQQVLELAVRAVSTNNAQPWEFSIVTGDMLDSLRDANVCDFLKNSPGDYVDAPVGPIYKERGRAIGKQIFSTMGIERGDQERRTWWVKRGFRFFEAPVVIFLSMDYALDEAAFRFDMGCVTQNICLAAMEYGLGTCVENQSIAYQRGIREILNFPSSKRLVCGIAIGYPDWDFPANHVVSPREDIASSSMWYGF